VPLEFRNLRYFVAVAEELHFSRAAERLYIAQPALSEQIRRLERDLGVELLRRTTRKVELTPAGEEFLVRARRILAEADAAMGEAERAARGEVGRLRVSTLGTAGIESVPRIMRAFGAERPNVALDLIPVSLEDHSGGLHDGATDVAFVWRPFRDDGLAFEPVAEDPRVAVLPVGHRLADRDRVRMQDLIDEPWPHVDTDPVALAFWTCADYRDGRPARRGPTIASMEQVFEAVRAGLCISTSPRSLASVQPWPGLVFVEVEDLSPAALALGWREADETPVVQAFVEIARRTVAAGDPSDPPD
jgi:DNA-binding transcriptional LysR family regulator